MTLRGSIALLAGAIPTPRGIPRCPCGGYYGPARRLSARQSTANCSRCGSVLALFDDID